MFDMIGRILTLGPALWVLMRWYNLGRSTIDIRRLFWTKGGILFCRQIFFHSLALLDVPCLGTVCN